MSKFLILLTSAGRTSQSSSPKLARCALLVMKRAATIEAQIGGNIAPAVYRKGGVTRKEAMLSRCQRKKIYNDFVRRASSEIPKQWRYVRFHVVSSRLKCCSSPIALAEVHKGMAACTAA